MSERKVLNKYYPPDFDPSKIPRMKLPKNRQYTVRLMAPFNMRCVTCGEYIYKGKKFNARKEDVEGQDYLGIRIYRFYIKCTRCLQEISFKTDPQNTDYEIEAGATRNFMALKLAEEQAQKEEDDRIEDESTNPMKLLENRTKQSKQEIELLESLEELRDLNRRQRTIDYDQMLTKFDTKEMQRQVELKQEEEDEKYIRSVFGAGGSKTKVLEEEILEDDTQTQSASQDGLETPEFEPLRKIAKTVEAKNVVPLVNTSIASASLVHKVPARSVGVLSMPVAKKNGLSGLIRLKQQVGVVAKPEVGKDTQPGTSSVGAVPSENKPETVVAKPVASGLSMLGSYSGTDSDSN